MGISSSSVTTKSTSTTPTTTSKTSLPYPTQSGIISSCNKFQNAVSGDYCYIFASNNGITTAELYAWNPILGPNGENCGTQFQAGVDYCVGVSSAAATTTTTSSVIPTQSGIAANCNRIVVAKSGDYCSLFAQDNCMVPSNSPLSPSILYQSLMDLDSYYDGAVIRLVCYFPLVKIQTSTVASTANMRITFSLIFST